MAAAMLADVPQGYAAAVTTLCAFPQDLLAEACFEALDFITYRRGALDIPHLLKRVQSADAATNWTEKSVQTALNALVYTLREAIRGAATGEKLVAVLKSAGASVWTGRATKLVRLAWEDRRVAVLADAAKLQASILHVGQLVDFQWKVGVSVESSLTSKLARPFVAVELAVAGASGAVQRTALELSLAEFQTFANHLRDMSAAIETA